MGSSEERCTTAVDIHPCAKLKSIKASEFLNLARTTTTTKVLFVYLSKLVWQQSNPHSCLNYQGKPEYSHLKHCNCNRLERIS